MIARKIDQHSKMITNSGNSYRTHAFEPQIESTIHINQNSKIASDEKETILVNSFNNDFSINLKSRQNHSFVDTEHSAKIDIDRDVNIFSLPNIDLNDQNKDVYNSELKNVMDKDNNHTQMSNRINDRNCMATDKNDINTNTQLILTNEGNDQQKELVIYSDNYNSNEIAFRKIFRKSETSSTNFGKQENLIDSSTESTSISIDYTNKNTNDSLNTDQSSMTMNIDCFYENDSILGNPSNKLKNTGPAIEEASLSKCVKKSSEQNIYQDSVIINCSISTIQESSLTPSEVDVEKCQKIILKSEIFIQNDDLSDFSRFESKKTQENSKTLPKIEHGNFKEQESNDQKFLDKDLICKEQIQKRLLIPSIDEYFAGKKYTSRKTSKRSKVR